MQSHDESSAAHPPARGKAIALAALCCLVLAWLLAFLASMGVRQGPSGKSMAGDFAIFLAASRTVQQGHDPYDRARLYSEERRMLQSQGIAVPRADAFIRVGNPPIFFWALQPLTHMPFRTAAFVWLLLLTGLIVAVALVLISTFALGRALPLFLFLAMPQTLLAVYYGNLDAVILVALVTGYLAARRRPFASGMLLSATLLKPQVALACAAVIILFAAGDRRRATTGALTGALLLLVVPFATQGPHLTASWLAALAGYSRELSVQPDIASLSGLYVYSAPWLIRSVAQAAGVLLAFALTAWWLQALRHVPRPVPLAQWSWLLVAWFLVSPFAHFHDELLLALPVAALLGPAGWGIRSRETLIVLYSLVLSLLLFPTARLHLDLQCLALLPLAVLSYRHARHVADIRVQPPTVTREEAVSVG